MRKSNSAIALPLLILCLVLLLSQGASAQLQAGVHLGYGRNSYSSILGEKNVAHTEWSSGVWADYYHEDLLLTGFYQGSLGLKDFKSSRHLGHIGAAYRFLEDDMLQVYGGLGYQLLSTGLNAPQIDEGKVNTFTGHGFSGQVVVGIDISDEFRTIAMVAASPWARWSHQADNVTDANIKAGHSFLYKLELYYDFSEEFGAHFSILGNTYRVPEFKEISETRSSSVSFNLGVTRHF
jgi:hypothetical protein